MGSDDECNDPLPNDEFNEKLNPEPDKELNEEIDQITFDLTKLPRQSIYRYFMTILKFMVPTNQYCEPSSTFSLSVPPDFSHTRPPVPPVQPDFSHIKYWI